MNWLSTLLVKPRLLPRLDFSSGIAADCRTMVVVPTMITSAEGVDRLIETLEIHHLANRDPHLHFALADGFPRCRRRRVMPEDGALLERIRDGRGSAEPEVSVRQRTHLLSVSPAAPLESGRRHVDGLRTQAGKAHGVQLAAPWRLARLLFRNRRGYRHPARHQVCHHARHRHPASARCRPPAGRHDGPSAEPSPSSMPGAAWSPRATASCSRASA